MLKTAIKIYISMCNVANVERQTDRQTIKQTGQNHYDQNNVFNSGKWKFIQCM